MAELKRLFLFVHLIMPEDVGLEQQYRAGWRELITTHGPNPQNALCILSSASNRKLNAIEAELHALALDQFAERCVLDPCDQSDSTKILLADDLLNLFRHRGRFTQWTLPEIWASVMARRWTEGLKRELTLRGLSYDPQTLEVTSCGQQWAGCLTKYAMFFPTYLGLTRKAQVRVDLSTGAGWPLQGARFVECIAMDRHVSLFLFETADGRPMGQFLDGLRGVWEPPHVAVMPESPTPIQVFTTRPCGAMEIQPADPSRPGLIVANVGDGCQPRFSTLLGQQGSATAFRATLAQATIEPCRDPDKQP